MKPEIVDLRTGSMEAGSLGSQLFDSLSSKEVRGEGDWRFSKTIDPMVLYDNVGLEMYPEVANLEAYYLFKDELDILKRHGDDIAARMMGLFTGSGGHAEKEEKLKQNGMNGTNGHGANGKLNENGKEKWGDDRVGANNYGVNGSLGKMNGCDSHLGGPAGGGTVTPVVVELGAGPLEKTSHLLARLHKLHIPGLKYYALDLEKRQLVQTLSELTTSFPKVATAHPSDASKISVGGICADYFQGLKWLSSGGLNNSSTTDPPKCLLHLGSSLGNFRPTSAISFLSRISELFRPGVDKLLICLDGCQDATKIERAYNDEFGKTAAWFQNGWRNAGAILQAKGGMPPAEYVNRFNAQEGRHEAYMRLREGGKVIVTVEGEEKELEFKEGELVNVEVSYKLTEKQAREMFRKSGLRVVQCWKGGRDGGDYYGVYLVERGDEYAEMGRNLPSMEEWRGLWKLWDEVTLNIIPKEMLHEKPIDLRHINLFYLEQIPTFLDIHLTRALDGNPTEPAYFRDIFERGIDPDMEDPTKIHRHSKVPKVKEDWPTLEEILAFRDAVRKRVETIYDEKKYEREGGGVDRAFGRSLWLGYEHEAMHLETILYMIVQMAPEKINPPSSASIPDFRSLSNHWNALYRSQDLGTTETFQPSSLNFGIDDVDTRDNAVLSPSHVYGWDNESPTRIVEVKKPFKISLLMITNGDYYDFWKQEPGRKTPESWKVDETGNVSVKTVYGLVPLAYANHWPVTGCGNMLTDYARSKGGRLPTEFELQMLYDKYPINPFTSNVDFQTWHPVPVSALHD
ncbi:hypothetical protein BT69DRAFT_1262315 [Atractiella rhizophila]|nr:hypothetical protein BT69DRAFT_1262315 [Atractiella rhizophila]